MSVLVCVRVWCVFVCSCGCVGLSTFAVATVKQSRHSISLFDDTFARHEAMLTTSKLWQSQYNEPYTAHELPAQDDLVACHHFDDDTQHTECSACLTEMSCWSFRDGPRGSLRDLDGENERVRECE